MSAEATLSALLSGEPGALAPLVLAALATLVSEDLTCLAVGALVAQGRVSFAAGSVACFAGIFLGDVLLFLCGRALGERALARAPFVWFLVPEDVARARAWLERRGAWVILASRFLPGARLPTYFACGALGTGLARFALWFAVAGALWTPLLVALAAGVGGGVTRAFDALALRGGPALLASLLVAWLLAALARALVTARGRALLGARLRRAARFEYWPAGLFYLPVVALVGAQALRRRALSFTAANPGIAHGGFVGESKLAIHGLLEGAGAPLPRQLALEAGVDVDAALARVRAFQDGHGLAFPLVVKPDAGQRGAGVRVVRDAAALRAALASSREARLVQEFVAGPEYGLFYVRHPGWERGRLLSITRKVLPAVRGDGRRTLEELVLVDREHRPMAPFFLARPRAELERVPAAGEGVLLGELGTHCRGARFLDGSALATPELEDALERIARATPGFHLGRFDVRAPSEQELRRGRFTILELNGVTAEAAHVYDPRHSLLAAWRSLLGQWRLAYAIGEANAARGARVSTWGELLGAVRDYRRLERSRAA